MEPGYGRCTFLAGSERLGPVPKKGVSIDRVRSSPACVLTFGYVNVGGIELWQLDASQSQDVLNTTRRHVQR